MARVIDLCFALPTLRVIVKNPADRHPQTKRPAHDGMTSFVIGDPARICHRFAFSSTVHGGGKRRAEGMDFSAYLFRRDS